MSIIEPAEILESLTALPEVPFAEGDPVLRQGTTTEHLLFLREGRVDIVRDGVILAGVTEPGAVFGDNSRPAAFGRRVGGRADALPCARGRGRAPQSRACPGPLREDRAGEPPRGAPSAGRCRRAARLSDMPDDIGRAMRIGVPM